MRQLIVTITTPEGEIIDRETLEVKHSTAVLDIFARGVGELESQKVAMLFVN